MNTTKNTIDQRLPWPGYDLLYCKTLFCMLYQVHMISKYAEKLNMLVEKRQLTEIFPFEAYHRSEELELPKENEYDFRNQHPKIT